jgi:flagellin-specific chaperone FliS
MNIESAISIEQSSRDIYVKKNIISSRWILQIFDTIIENIEKLRETHPKTDFSAFGEILYNLKILSDCIEKKNGGSLALEIYELYDFCTLIVRRYLEDKNFEKIEEVKLLIKDIADSFRKVGQDNIVK